jgi:hypothetical protein
MRTEIKTINYAHRNKNDKLSLQKKMIKYAYRNKNDKICLHFSSSTLLYS